jgi:hypothetical protein
MHLLRAGVLTMGVAGAALTIDFTRFGVEFQAKPPAAGETLDMAELIASGPSS